MKCFGVEVSYPLGPRGAENVTHRDTEVAVLAHKTIRRLPPPERCRARSAFCRTHPVIPQFDTGAGPFGPCRASYRNNPRMPQGCRPMRDISIDFWRKRGRDYQGLTRSEARKLERVFRARGFTVTVRPLDRCAF